MKSIIIIEKDLGRYIDYKIEDFELLLKTKYSINNFQELLHKKIKDKKYDIKNFERFYFAIIKFDKIGGYLCRFFNVEDKKELQKQNFLPDNFSQFERKELNIENNYMQNHLISDFNKDDEVVVLYNKELLETSNLFIKELKNLQIEVHSNNL